jgi:hypothetical protein
MMASGSFLPPDQPDSPVLFYLADSARAPLHLHHCAYINPPCASFPSSFTPWSVPSQALNLKTYRCRLGVCKERLRWLGCEGRC